MEPQHCLGIEEEPSGVEAAQRAGRKAIGVLTTHQALEADAIVRSLKDLTWDVIENLIRES